MIKAAVILLVAAFIAFGFGLAGLAPPWTSESLLATGLVLALLSLVNRDSAPAL